MEFTAFLKLYFPPSNCFEAFPEGFYWRRCPNIGEGRAKYFPGRVNIFEFERRGGGGGVNKVGKYSKKSEIKIYAGLKNKIDT